MDKVRVGVIGTSWWTETFHLPGLKSHPSAVVTAICGRNKDRARRVADGAAVPAVFTDYRAMLSTDLMDAVVVATPDVLHHRMVKDALGAGLHVLCEKPLASSAELARDLADTARAADRLNMVMFTWRWFGAIAYAHRLVMEGFLGRCREAHFGMQASYGLEPGYNWRFDPRHGTGVLGDFGSHMIDLAHWFLGDVSTVGASLSTLGQHVDTDDKVMAPVNDAANLTVSFEGGAFGSIELSAMRHVGPLPTYQVRLYGDEGTLEARIEPPEGWLRGRRRGDSDWQELSVPNDVSGCAGSNVGILGMPLLAPLTNLPAGDRLFVDAVLGHHVAVPTFEDGWRVQRVIDAAFAADRIGQRVAIS